MIDRVALDAAAAAHPAARAAAARGRDVVARVASRGEAHGVIVLAGVPLDRAAARRRSQAGQTLRLPVAEVTPEHVTLRLDPQTPPAAAPPRAGAAGPRRRGWRSRSRRAQPRRRREATRRVALRSTPPALGRLDLRIDLARGTVSGAVAGARRARR